MISIIDRGTKMTEEMLSGLNVKPIIADLLEQAAEHAAEIGVTADEFAAWAKRVYESVPLSRLGVKIPRN
jgi:pantoate kinase